MGTPRECSSFGLGLQIMNIALSYVVQDKMPLFLAVKVYFSVALEEI